MSPFPKRLFIFHLTVSPQTHFSFILPSLFKPTFQLLLYPLLSSLMAFHLHSPAPIFFHSPQPHIDGSSSSDFHSFSLLLSSPSLSLLLSLAQGDSTHDLPTMIFFLKLPSICNLLYYYYYYLFFKSKTKIKTKSRVNRNILVWF